MPEMMAIRAANLNEKLMRSQSPRRPSGNPDEDNALRQRYHPSGTTRNAAVLPPLASSPRPSSCSTSSSRGRRCISMRKIRSASRSSRSSESGRGARTASRRAEKRARKGGNIRTGSAGFTGARAISRFGGEAALGSRNRPLIGATSFPLVGFDRWQGTPRVSCVGQRGLHSELAGQCTGLSHPAPSTRHRINRSWRSRRRDDPCSATLARPRRPARPRIVPPALGGCPTRGHGSGSADHPRRSPH
jgi:hypothetical protein